MNWPLSAETIPLFGNYKRKASCPASRRQRRPSRGRGPVWQVKAKSSLLCSCAPCAYLLRDESSGFTPREPFGSTSRGLTCPAADDWQLRSKGASTVAGATSAPRDTSATWRSTTARWRWVGRYSGFRRPWCSAAKRCSRCKIGSTVPAGQAKCTPGGEPLNHWGGMSSRRGTTCSQLRQASARGRKSHLPSRLRWLWPCGRRARTGHAETGPLTDAGRRRSSTTWWRARLMWCARPEHYLPADFPMHVANSSLDGLQAAADMLAG